MRFAVASLCLLSLAGPPAHAQSACAPSETDKTCRDLKSVQKHLVRSEFERIQELFAQGKPATFSDFKHSFPQFAKTTWAGTCYSTSGESRGAEIIASHKTYKEKEYPRLALRPEWVEEDSVTLFDKFNKTSFPAYSNEPLTSEEGLLSYAFGIPAIFSGDQDLMVSSYRRVETSDGGVKIIAQMKEIARGDYPERTSERTKPIVEHAKTAKAAAFCEFTRQYALKVTRQEKTEGCDRYYRETKKRFEKKDTTRAVIGAVMLPFNFIGTAAMVADKAFEKNPEQDLNTMIALLDEIKNPEKPSPTVERLHAAILKQNPKWGDKKALVDLLKTANDSFFFCSPHLPEGHTFNVDEIAIWIGSGTLKDQTFVKEPK